VVHARRRAIKGGLLGVRARSQGRTQARLRVGVLVRTMCPSPCPGRTPTQGRDEKRDPLVSGSGRWGVSWAALGLKTKRAGWRS
jgi:hypothetical protein